MMQLARNNMDMMGLKIGIRLAALVLCAAGVVLCAIALADVLQDAKQLIGAVAHIFA